MKVCRWTAAVLCVVAAFTRTAVYAEADGSLTVKTDPDGIEVWLDDKYIGDSPVNDKKLKAGRYGLKLVDPVQHTSTVEEVFIQAGEQTVVEKAVKSRYGSIKINTDPQGADVSILTSLGKTPLSNDFIIPGKYRLEINSPGYKKALADVVVPRGEIITLQKNLDKKKALDGKAIARLSLGLAAIGGFVWALVERTDPNFGGTNGSVNGQALGICLGCISVVSFEIVAFY